MKKWIQDCLLAACFAAVFPGLAAGEGRVLVFAPAKTNWNAGQQDQLLGRLKQSGCEVVRLSEQEIATPGKLQAGDLLVLCDATRIPALAVAHVADYVKRGGKLMALGGPFFEHVTWPYAGEFLDREGILARVARDVKPKVLFDFESADLGNWLHSSSNAKSASALRPFQGGADGSQGAALLDLVDVSGWETFIARNLDQPFPAGHTWTTFWAKGESDQGPSQLMVEWQERDNSRWIAVVNLTKQWKFYALPPEAFTWWTDPPAPGRGHTGDTLRPQNAASLTIGLAQSHSDLLVPHGRHRIWIDRIGTAPPPPGLEGMQGAFISSMAMPVIETVSPSYKLYPVANSTQVRVNRSQVIAGSFNVPPIASTFAPHPRPSGTTIHKHRRWRFVPLVECLGQDGLPAGAAASLLIQGEKPESGGLVAAVPVAGPRFFASEATQDWLVKLAGRMLNGVFLYEGGARYYASFGGESMPVGAVVTNRGKKPAKVVVRAVAYHQRPDVGRVWEKSWELLVPPGDSRRAEGTWEIPGNASGPMRVEVTLESEGNLLDRLAHDVRIWRPKAKPQFVTTRGGQFYLNDKPWFVHGVNYMPSSGIGSEDFGYFGEWMGPEPYDPEIIHRDLLRLKQIGINVVSAFLDHSSLRERNLIDFLAQCEELGLKVNLSLRPGTPMDFQWEKIREMVLSSRLPENDTLFAYDLAWEPLWGLRPQRRHYDRLWREWIERRYQSVEAAEKAWKFAAPRENGQVAGPSDEQVSQDGAWRAMVLDYRRFLNDLIHDRYSRARELMRTIDRHHLVSFRMTMTSDPTRPAADMTYDMAGLARAVDLMEPEGYGRIGDWKQVRPGQFTVAYARAVAPDLPVMWAEFGYSIWSQANRGPSPERMAFAEKFYDDFYKMAYQSGSNGTIAWFFSGGYRVDEKSDYGILNPDGSWRPHTHVMHRWAKRMTEPRELPKPDVWIPIELGRDVDGIAGIYRRAEKEFWQAVESGKTPGLKLIQGEKQ